MAGRDLQDKLNAGGGLAAGSAFALGLVAGVLLKGAATQVTRLMREARSHHGDEPTVTYDQNLPDSLGRREPQSGQPRYGSTGAIGVPPTAAGVPPSRTE